MAEAVARRPGRPAAAESERRLRHILDIARRMFLDQGYGASSLEGIAAAAGVAKTTLYRHFGGKKGLFERCIDDATAGFRGQLAHMSRQPHAVGDGLLHMARCLLDVIYLPDSISLMRLFFAESPRFPELGRAYGTHARSILMTEMVAFLDRHAASGGLVVEDAAVAADQFHHLVMSSRYFDVLLGVAPVPDRHERAAIAAQAVRVFLSGCVKRPVP